ncbi:ribonuclease H-like domain-containing protein [Tanacetum coccineum]
MDKDPLMFKMNMIDHVEIGASTLKTELRSIQLGTLSMEAYFQKIESLVTTLTSLDCIVNEEDVVHYAIDGLPKKYNQVCGYMHYQNTFPDLKTVRSLLVTEEMRLKTKEIALPADSSSPMVLMAQSGTPRRSSNTQGKSWKPCFNFANGSCRFVSACHYVHDLSAKPITNTHAKHSSFNNTEALLTKILDKLRDYRNSSEPSLVNHTNSLPVARALLWVNSSPAQYHQAGPSGSVTTGQATLLPHAFTAGTLHDPFTGA